MKKLKVWQIILLVIFYPIGLCVLIYRIWKKHQIRLAEVEAKQTADEIKSFRASEEARRAAERRSKIAEDVRLYDDFTFKVVGVSFKNEDGRSRQALLGKLKRGEYPFNTGSIDLAFHEYDFDGEPAVGVFLSGQQVGNISKTDLNIFLPRFERFESCLGYEVTGGGVRNGEKLNYGLTLRLRFKKPENVI